MGDDPRLAAVLLHLDEVALARAGDLLDHGAGILVIHVDGDFLDRFQRVLAVIAQQNLGAADRQLEPFAAHVLDQDAHLQFAPARDFEGLAAGRVGHADRHVGLGFLQQALTDHAGLHLLAVAAGQRAIVDPEGDRDGRRVDGLCFQRLVHGQGADRVGHGGLGHAGKRHDVPRDRFVDILHRQAPEGLDPGHAEAFDILAHAAERLHGRPHLDPARLDPARQQPAHEGIGPERGGQHAEIFALALDLPGLGHMVHDEVEERVKVLARAIELGIRPPGPARGVEMREVELVLVGIERGEQVEAFVERPVGLGIGLVDLVEHHDRTQAERQRLRGHELGLRHRAFGCVDQQHHPVDHRQDALHLAAEIGVAGGVDDVDAGALPFDAGGLGEDGDPALAFEVVGVHGALGHGLVGAEGARLFQKLVDKRGLAMVNVRDDRDIAEVHTMGLSGKAELAPPLQGCARKGQSKTLAKSCAISLGRNLPALSRSCAGAPRHRPWPLRSLRAAWAGRRSSVPPSPHRPVARLPRNRNGGGRRCGCRNSCGCRRR